MDHNNSDPDPYVLDRIERAIAELRGDVALGFARVDERLTGVDERLTGVDERLTGVDERLVGMDQQFAAVHQEIRDGDEQTRSQMRMLIDSVRDDVRIFAEAHVALERRVTTLERRPR